MPRAFSLIPPFCRFHTAAHRGRRTLLEKIFSAILSCALSAGLAHSQTSHRCQKVELEGEALQGSEWQASIGQNWLIRLVPIGQGHGSSSDFSGWDIAISPANDQNYPDALLLATPPYSSLNPRQIATTYGMRAQDAIAWSPRHFHFFTSAADLTRARQLYRTLLNASSDSAARQQASSQLLDLNTATAAGRLDILDAHLVAGTADPAPFATQWAASLMRIPHTLDGNGQSSTPSGILHSMRFRLTLWLPEMWKHASHAPIMHVKCAE